MVTGKRLSTVPLYRTWKAETVFDTGTTQIVGGPDSIAKRFKLICGAKSAPPLGPGVYTVRCSVPLVVREPSISQYLVASTLQSLLS